MIRSVILMSGGLDSLVSLALTKEEYSVNLGLTFDYGQKALQTEISASEKICKFYNINHKVIKLDWLKDITNTALVADKEVPHVTMDDISSSEFARKSADLVWVPNRNGLFLNIAASFADSYGYDYIIFGANKEEAETFSDNSMEFISALNESFKFSTKVHPKIYAPLINFTKSDIVKKALEQCAPLELGHSCYNLDSKHCGECESCMRLKRALEENNCEELIEVLFHNEHLLHK